MLFNSYIFVLLFFPLCIAGYFLLNHLKKYNLALLFLLGMSLWFYGYFNPSYLVIILTSVAVNYAVYRLLGRLESHAGLRKGSLILGIILNVGILFYFKYMDFFIQTANELFNNDWPLHRILLPLGISFFTFQQLSFIIDAYKKEVPEYNLLEYACFVTYFPQLIAGPIVTHDELVPQFRDISKKKWDWGNFSRGFYIFTLGMGKKVLIADTFGNAANIGFADIASLDTTNAILVMLSYTIQIYFDFSGYCDMAIGIGKMMNIDLPLNFNSPYKALTITEFWDRWHMTLTRFFTRYIYIPLGGNRRGKARTYLNTMIVFLISGFWHGANWTFVLWGVLHGIFSVITRHFSGFFKRLHPALSWIVTFGFVNLTWILFRADSIGGAAEFLKRILRLNFGAIRTDIAEAISLPELEKVVELIPIGIRLNYIVLVFLFVVALLLILGSKNAYQKMQDFKPTVPRMITTAALFVWCVVSFSGVSTFLYFNF